MGSAPHCARQYHGLRRSRILQRRQKGVYRSYENHGRCQAQEYKYAVLHRKWINTIIGSLKTATCGTHHAFDFAKYGALNLAEAQYRFNRRFDLSSILRSLLGDAVRTTKRTEASLRQAEGQR